MSKRHRPSTVELGHIKARAVLDQNRQSFADWFDREPETMAAIFQLLAGNPRDVLDSLREGPEELTREVCKLARYAIVEIITKDPRD
jgi:hypothetical protein